MGVVREISTVLDSPGLRKKRLIFIELSSEKPMIRSSLNDSMSEVKMSEKQEEKTAAKKLAEFYWEMRKKRRPSSELADMVMEYKEKNRMMRTKLKIKQQDRIDQKQGLNDTQS